LRTAACRFARGIFLIAAAVLPYLTPEGANIFGGGRPKGDDDHQ
jgi:hypothetical protein